MHNYNDCPLFLKNFLLYLETVKGRSITTINAYYIDLKNFLKFINILKKNIQNDQNNDISKLSIDDISNITLNDIYEYLNYVKNEKKNTPKTRARKISSIRSFYKYLTNIAYLINNNPVKNLELPSSKKSLPIFMTLDQSIQFIESINTSFTSRDRCIAILLLNCGMRISELTNIKLSNIINNNSVRLLGKGNKERIIYLNTACQNALEKYLRERIKTVNIIDKNYLFISKKGKRIGVRRVQYIIEDCLKKANLSNMGFSAHKLRHTAATLMYQYGNVDIRILKDILGHANLSTTEIYTHVSNENVKNALDSNPLSKI